MPKLKSIILGASDVVDKFPNLLDLDVDFSKIQDLSLISDLSKAKLAAHAFDLASQFECYFGYVLKSTSHLRAAIQNYFILSSSKIHILQEILQVDIEMNPMRLHQKNYEERTRKVEMIMDKTDADAKKILGQYSL